MGTSRLSTGILILLPVTLGLYLLSILFGSTLAQNIISPLCALAAAAALLLAGKWMRGGYRHSHPFWLMAAGCIAWGAADIGWLFLDLRGVDPSVNQALWVLYFIVNLCLTVAFMYIWIATFSKWNFVQLFIDVVAILLVSAVFGWVVYLRRDWTALDRLFQQDFTSIASLMLDTILAVGVFQWFATARSGKIPPFMLVLALCVDLYALVDMVYYYSLLWNIDIPSLATDFAYSLSLVGIGFGALMTAHQGKPPPELSNIGTNRRRFTLFTIPLVTLVLGFMGLEGVVVRAIDIVTFLIIILLHMGFSRYIQLAMENERLLHIEKAANTLLEQRVAEQVEAITRLANQDVLTTLTNRKHFLDTLEDRFRLSPLSKTLAVVVMDVDRFKTFNDHFGSEAADMMLVELAQRLKRWSEGRGMPARLGGDEYGLLLEDGITEQVLAECCDSLVQLFNEPLIVAGNRLEVTVSIGAALRSAGLPDGRQLLQNAEIALHQAKSQGYNNRQLFDPLLSHLNMNEGRVELLLRQADIERDFELYYQPQYSLPERRLVGAEALCRWHSNRLGYIAPSIFIPVAEKIGFIGKLGGWVLREAARQAVAWKQLRREPIRIGVNISPAQLSDQAFIGKLEAAVQDAGATPELIDLEITESLMLQNEDSARGLLYQLKGFGYSLSIDDFGSGYASMGYLGKYPLDRMKVDKSLIDGLLVRDGSGYTIVKSIIGMAQSLGIQTIAEGVELDEQLQQLETMGCDQVQGFLLGRPVPAAEFERLFLYL